MLLKCSDCHKEKDESVFDDFDGFFSLCIECKNPDKWKQIQLREKYGDQYSCLKSDIA